jgi:hypothetical protein
MKRIIPGTTLCEGWTWVDITGKPPTLEGELFSSRRGAIHQAEGTQEEIIYVKVVACGPRARPPRRDFGTEPVVDKLLSDVARLDIALANKLLDALNVRGIFQFSDSGPFRGAGVEVRP